ncbi:MAG TPA: HDIG domain-containing protein [Abditibacteriaceae bacterium]
MEPTLPKTTTESTVEIDRTLLSEEQSAELTSLLTQTPLVPPREPLGVRIAALMARRHWLLLPLCVALLWAAISYRPPGESLALRVGDVVAHDVVAPHSATVLDREMTERNRDAAAELVPPQYDVRPGAQGEAQSELRLVLDSVRREIVAADLARSARPNRGAQATPQTAKNSSDVQARVLRLNRTLSKPLPPDAARQALQTSPARWRLVAREASAALRSAYEIEGKIQKIRSDVADDVMAARRRMQAALKLRASRSGLNDSEIETAYLLASHAATVPTLVVNTDKTELAREAARDNVHEVFRSVAPGTLLIAAGTRLDAARRAELQDMELIAPRFDASAALARLALCVVVVCFAAAYIARLHPQLEAQPASLWLAAMVPIAFVALFRWALRVPHGDSAMVPLGAVAALLLTMLINERIGMLAAFAVPALCAFIAGAEPSLFLAAALSAAVGVLSVAEISSRGHIARAALILAGTNAVLALALGLLRRGAPEEIVSLACWGAFAGGVSVLAAVGLAQFLERPFNITTHLRLLELSGPDEIVMRRMQAEAPGTYTHSLMVGMLSEAAAKAVGADPLLCRVGGLYHDIGKLRRPHCFVENQSGENVHDRLSPQFSSLLIISHVRDGIELGRAIRLPQPVLDIIAQHHGTSLIAYFFHRAQSQKAESAVEIDRTPDETLYRYPGPKPQSKESAIVMLADTVEASSRALPNVSPERLNAHIRTMIQARLADGELSECELTLRELNTIETSFAHVLRGVLHHRIEYPDPAREPAGDNWMNDALADPLDDSRHDNHHGTSSRTASKNSRRDDPSGSEHFKERKRRARSVLKESANGTAVGSTNGHANGSTDTHVEPRRSPLVRLANGRIVRKQRENADEPRVEPSQPHTNGQARGATDARHNTAR